MLFPNDVGTLAVGAVSTFGPDKGNDTDVFAIGPAIGAILKSSKWTNYIWSVAAQPIRLFFNPLYNFKNELGTRRWNLIGGMALIVR